MKINDRLIDILNAHKKEIIFICPNGDPECVYKGYINDFDKNFIDITTPYVDNLYIGWEFVESFYYNKREVK